MMAATDLFSSASTPIGAKVAHVRAALQRPAGDHHCHWSGCSKRVPPAVWGCREHWYALPEEIRRDIFRTYRPGQEDTKTPSAAYVRAARAAEDWIAANKPQSSSKITARAAAEPILQPGWTRNRGELPCDPDQRVKIHLALFQLPAATHDYRAGDLIWQLDTVFVPIFAWRSA